jgi:serine/threonine protein kinase/Tol biopolymer transport system component
LIGQTLSHYRITSALGVGGMGEVYRATDTNLGREVAIKVLPPEVARDAERLARFRREAHLLASLNHPNIAAIYGLEEEAGKPFLALELVEGKDLKERIDAGAIPVDEALEIAERIAEALEEAHGKGIVHRDLKPANVKVTPDGKVKVLDFGLAKAWAADAAIGSAPSLSQSPTLTHTGTIAGVILGTAGYMSPEQARGKPVDKRADVWSFGVLLWEMLTGRALFAGETVTDVIAAVVTREPDLSALPKATPPALRRLIARCLRKDPRQRLPDIGAARLELQEVLAGATPADELPAGEPGGTVREQGWWRRRERWGWAATVLGLAGLAAVPSLRRPTEARALRAPAHFVLDTPGDLSFGDFNPPALSPDGRYLAFVGTSSSGTTQLWMRPLDSPVARAAPGTEGATAPFWSPDSTAVAFATGRDLRKLVLAGGAVQRICTVPSEMGGGTWNDTGTIVFWAGAQTSLLYSVSATGGEARPLTAHDASRGETAHQWPQFLPDGRHLLFEVGSSKPENAGLYVTSLDAPAERRRILSDTARFVYAARALLSVHDGVLTAQPFDAKSLTTTGDAVPIASPVASWTVIPSWGWFSASSSGHAAWISGQSTESQLTWVSRKGVRLGTLGEPGRYGQIAMSADNQHVAVELADAAGQFDLWTIDVARGVATRLTTDSANERDPVWSPDGHELVFSSDANGDQDLLRTDLSGAEAPAPLPRGVGHSRGERDIAKCWLREGNTLLYKTIGAETAVRAVSLDGGSPAQALLEGFGVDQPQVSPDGRWLAYISTESGRYEVYVQPFRRRGARVRVSANGGGQPRWRGDGRELFYLSVEGALAVDVRESASGLEVGMPKLLVPANALPAVVEGLDYSDYAVSADGQRFLVKLRSDKEEQPRIHVLLDWPSLVH